jgi:Na+/H+ antiporter NhaC
LRKDNNFFDISLTGYIFQLNSSQIMIIKIKVFIFCSIIFLLFFQNGKAKGIHFPSLALSGTDISISGEGIPDSIRSFTIQLKSGDLKENFFIDSVFQKFSRKIVVEHSGNFQITVNEIPGLKSEIRIIPGWLSILPPLIAILLALIFRQVILSLMIGIYAGAVFIYDFNFLTALFRLIDHYVITAIIDKSHAEIIVFTLLFGGVIGLISKSGGTKGIANSMSRFARSRSSGMFAAWLSGIIIFFDDYANTLVVGNLMRPLTDKLKISREKLSFIVDATAAPVASVVIVSSWIGYEVGLIQDGLTAIGSNANAYSVFIDTIPFRFYPIAMIIFVLLVALSRRDFGKMRVAEARAATTGKLFDDKSTPLLDKNIDLESEAVLKQRWFNGVIPILVIILGTIAGLLYTGIDSLQQQGIQQYNLRDIIGSSDSYLALLWSSFAAAVVAAVLILSQKILTINQTIDAWLAGIKSMTLAIVILTLAWGIGSVTTEIKTADYIISLISDTIDPRFLPVLIFLVCGLTSFATGTSWGTMAVMMPIVIPLTAHVTHLFGYNNVDTQLMLNGTISSVLAGCVWGDHCSPISDTTILSSMASGCDHIDHVRTQLPYAIFVGIICMLLGDIASAFGVSPFLSILFITIVMLFVLYFFGKKN